MSTQSPNIILAAATPADHYNWIAAFSAALDALGVAKGTDTGQVNLSGTTLPLPSLPTSGYTANQAYYDSPALFQIRTLAATGMPTIYLRFDFGIFYNAGWNQNNAETETQYWYPAVKVSVGGGTDGAGNLTSIQPGSGIPSFADQVNASNTTSAYYGGSSSSGSLMPSLVAQECDFASDGQNYLTIMLGENAPVYETKSILTFGIERTINQTNGLYDNTGFHAFCGTQGSSNWFYSDFPNQRQWSANTPMPSIAPPFNISGAVNVVDIFPFIGCATVAKGAPTIGVSYYASGVNSPISFPATLYSTAHTYKCCPRSVNQADPYGTGTRIALRFD